MKTLKTVTCEEWQPRKRWEEALLAQLSAVQQSGPLAVESPDVARVQFSADRASVEAVLAELAVSLYEQPTPLNCEIVQALVQRLNNSVVKIAHRAARMFPAKGEA